MTLSIKLILRVVERRRESGEVRKRVREGGGGVERGLGDGAGDGLRSSKHPEAMILSSQLWRIVLLLEELPLGLTVYPLFFFSG